MLADIAVKLITEDELHLEDRSKMLEINYRRVLAALLLLSDEEADESEMEDVEEDICRHVATFKIISPDTELVCEVGPGKFKTAALLLFLAEKHNLATLRLGEQDVQFVREYFPPHLVHDALHNPQTTHVSLKALLSEGPVEITVSR